MKILTYFNILWGEMASICFILNPGKKSLPKARIIVPSAVILHNTAFN